MLSNKEVRDVITLNHEVRVVEFKAAGVPSDRPFLAKVARACLAMANQRGGGHVLIGIDDDDPIAGPNGLTDTQLRAWQDFDSVSASLNAYADPPLALEIAARVHPSGNSVIVIEIDEFRDVPVLCKKDASGGVLARGQLYTRSLAKPESSTYHSQAELREVLDLGVQKGLRAFLDSARNAGIDIGPSEEQQFLNRLSSYFSDEDVQALVGEPHLKMLFRPNDFQSERIPFNELEMGLARAQTRIGNASFPPLGGEVETSQHAITWRRPFGSSLVWRFDESGAFVLVQKLRAYQRDEDAIGNPDDPRITGYIPIRLIVVEVTRALAFAARLMNLLDADSAMCTLSFNNIRGLTLTVNEPHGSGLFGDYIYGAEAWEKSIPLTVEHRTIGTADLAVDVAHGLLHRFGWSSILRENVVALQAQYLNG